jgi:hypothetical protein
MKLSDLISRSDVETLQELLGRPTVSLINQLEQQEFVFLFPDFIFIFFNCPQASLLISSWFNKHNKSLTSVSFNKSNNTHLVFLFVIKSA